MNKHRPERDLIKKILLLNGKWTARDAANAFGMSKQQFDNKLFRSSFSIRDFITVSTLKGYQVILHNENEDIVIDPRPFINDTIKDNYIRSKSDQIEKLSNECEKLRKELGILNDVEEV